jgi:hypothetical protein
MFVGRYGPSFAIRATRLSRRILWAASSLALLLVLDLSAEAQPFRPSSGPIWRAEERLVLAALYAATNGDGWKERKGWLSEESPCEWHGIRCETEWIDGQERSRVTGVDLSFNGLRGSLPPAIATLKYLKFLEVAGNSLSGPVPEEFLDRWDRKEVDFHGDGNLFSNLPTRVRVNQSVVSILCSDDDAEFQLDVQEDGSAVFQTVRCTEGTERGTHCLVREGIAPGLYRLSRALKKLGFYNFLDKYDNASVTHGTFLTTSVWMGDGSAKSVRVYAGDAPLQVWSAQQLFLALRAEITWQREYEKPQCQMHEGL